MLEWVDLLIFEGGKKSTRRKTPETLTSNFQLLDRLRPGDNPDWDLQYGLWHHRNPSKNLHLISYTKRHSKTQLNQEEYSHLWYRANTDTPCAPLSTKNGPRSYFKRASSKGGKRRFGGWCQTKTSSKSSSSQLKMFRISSEFIPSVPAAKRLKTLATNMWPWYFSRIWYKECISPITSASRTMSAFFLTIRV